MIKSRYDIVLCRVDRGQCVLHHSQMKVSLLISTILLTGCASVSTRLPDISMSDMAAEQVEQEGLAFTEMERLQGRLLRVANPILGANTALCPKTQQYIGVKTHKLSTYPKSVRTAAARELGATEQESVFFVQKRSAADVAGIRRGDQLLDAKSKPVSAIDERFQDVLSSGKPLRIKRGDDIIEVDVKPEQSCGYKIRLSMSSNINAYADGRNITVTTGMMNFVESDDELALIIGHELAHNTMGHIRKIVTNIILSGLSTKYTRPFESEADYVGMYYLVRAGFSPDNVEDVWRRLGVVNPKSVARAKSHPSYPDRYLRLAATRDEIRAKQEAGEPLIPNFLSGQDGEDSKS